MIEKGTYRRKSSQLSRG